ncbi:trimeric intracellular cation channel family protein [Parafrankia sp. FMc2]|uniref:trimeric intracellular cation channel family protein n=1 Tax=Parafrankia sp. FMc2 TaxID=3233196 RepID=UPI0034D58F89
MDIRLLDLVGVFAFAFFGASSATESRLNLWGVITCGTLTALGGGTVRDLLLDRQPAYFHDYAYVYAVMVAVTLALAGRRHVDRISTPMEILDSVGLVAFSYIGAQAARNAGLGIVPTLGFAALTAVGGGACSDVVAGRTPMVFRDRSCLVPPLVLGVLCWTMGPHCEEAPTATALLIGVLLLRVGTVHGARLARRRRREAVRSEARPTHPISLGGGGGRPRGGPTAAFPERLALSTRPSWAGEAPGPGRPRNEPVTARAARSESPAAGRPRTRGAGSSRHRADYRADFRARRPR